MENEERVAMAALRLTNLAVPSDHGPVRFWVRDIQASLLALQVGSTMNDSTVNRALNRFTEWGWMWAAWETADPANHLSSKPRLYFRLTEEGHRRIVELLAARRRSLPVWILDPEAAVGERVDDVMLAVSSSPFSRPGGAGRSRVGQTADRQRRRA